MFFKSNHRGSHIPPSWLMSAGCVLVAGIHPSRTRMSRSFEPVRWNACVHRLDLGLYSHPKEFLGNGIRTNVSPKGKIPSPGGSMENRTRDAASRRTASPTHYRLSYSGRQQSIKMPCRKTLSAPFQLRIQDAYVRVCYTHLPGRTVGCT